ncbi:Gfo/Idh/MocA family oxidoreductase [Campylobacter sp. JMF_06 NA1]|uniref:Gfo/Idh/MocA family protein n=1 Tax=Campylobacter sp. JMF_06 NA1 TaxID=2983823 RepID=UPI0022EA0C95|nr:Gfo/Idh/MocA family oxidoreductase [Campylobacter sp. JMF_06 NA1]MDA3077677.1 Gfo/Idh/MocA family oxidoreductase [Campylobacter sp. JMF_06 NA1]
MKKKIAIIGLGELGAKHFKELRRSDYFDLVALYDKEKTEDFGPRYPLYNDLAKMYESAKPDAVVIATPPATHKEIILKCIPFTKNIFVESPLAGNLAEAREINYSISINGAKLGVGYAGRYNPVIISLCRELAKDEKIYSINFVDGFSSESANCLQNALIRDLDLIALLSKSEISSQNICKNGDSNGIGVAFRTKSMSNCTILLSNLYPLKRHGVEICTNSGVYFGDLESLNLFKVTNDGRINQRVDRDDYALRYQHKAFLNLIENSKFEGIATPDEAIKLRELIS